MLLNCICKYIVSFKMIFYVQIRVIAGKEKMIVKRSNIAKSRHTQWCRSKSIAGGGGVLMIATEALFLYISL